MAASDAETPEDYLAGLPDERRELVELVRSTIVGRLPDGFEEAVTFGMLGYVVPLEDSGETYNGKPLSVITIANQKHHVAVYLMGVYADEGQRDWFTQAWKASGKKLDLGKACLRLKSIDDVAFGVLGDAAARVTPSDLIAAHQAVHRAR